MLLNVSATLAIILSSCANIPPADVPVFTQLNKDKAYYVYTISNKEGYVNNSDILFNDPDFSKTPLTWNQVKLYSIYVPSFSWSKIEAMILKLCKKQKQDCESHGNPDIKFEKFHKVIEQEYRNNALNRE
jgi:hypothetical protein